MDRNKAYKFYKMFFALIGAVCMILALVQLAFEIKSEFMPGYMKGPDEVKHKVLFLSSYDPMYYTYKDQIRGIEEGLYSNDIEFDICYMDTKIYGTDQDIEEFYKYFSKRYNNDVMHYEAILLGDDAALKFALEHQEELFKGLPMVFFGINSLDLAMQAEANPMMTGFYELDYFADTFEEAITLFPEKKKLYAICDTSPAGKTDLEKFLSYRGRYPEYDFHAIISTELELTAILEALKKVPEDAIFFFMTCYDDRNGERHSLFETTSLIVNNVKAPIFRPYAEGREYGVLGGTYMDFSVQTRNAAEIIAEVLNNGADISTYELSLYTPSITQYNYMVLKQYGLSENLLPRDTIYIDKPESFVEVYKNMLPVAVLIVVSMLSFMGSILIAFVQEKQYVRALKASKAQLVNSQIKLIYQAEYDELLGLLNRRAIVDNLNSTLKTDQEFTVIMLDLDGFKDINENYGHDVGDNLLKDIAKALRKFAEKNGMTLGRYGGDEFIMFAEGKILNKESPLVKDITDIFSKPLSIGSGHVVMSASVGISNSDGETPPEQHVINAEIAMYEAKNRGKNMVFVYEDDMKQKVMEESRIKDSFLKAFDNDGFYMKYQPKVSAQTKEVIGYEALVRLRDSKYGPGQFIPVIEKSGWTSRLGRLITKLVVKQLGEWKKMGKEIKPVSINFSSRQINDTEYCKYLEAVLKEYDVDPKYVQIEITESLLMEENSITKELFESFKNLGVILLLDDFGTGYSSLAYLTYVPVEDVKLDKSLVDTYLCEGKEDFIKDVIQLVHDMGKSITIEGVEKDWQYNKLREFNADTIQGYYFSPPLDPEEAIDFKAE